MPLRRARPFAFRPWGTCDAVDTSNAPKGAMVSLSNLVPDPSTAGVFVPRPAAKLDTLLPNTALNSASAVLIVGDVLYGMIASTLYPGFDEPFVYNLDTGAFVAVEGVTASNLPTSQPTTGAWQPPSIAIVGTRVVVCHPGFDGVTNFLGWFDISKATITTTVDTALGKILYGNPQLLGVQPGMKITTPTGDFPDSLVVSTTQYVNATYATFTSGSTAMTAVANDVGIQPGQLIEGAGIQSGTTVTAVSGANVTMSLPAVATATLGPITFSGGTIEIADAATVAANGISVTITGGSSNAPLWGAGNMDRNPFTVVPSCVAQFNGRAYYGSGSAIVFSDSGFALRRSDAVITQVLGTSDGFLVTAIAPLMLGAPIQGGIVQALLAFEGSVCIRQITGDIATSNLAMNLLPVETGTDAPNSITPCEIGTAFMSPDGFRVVKFDGTVTEPIGQDGAGVTLPFINALYPSRVCAAANRGVLRASVQNAGKSGNPVEEYWYDLARRRWTGPHTFPASLIQPWRTSFVMVPVVQSAIWQSDVVPTPTSTYVENGNVLTWTFAALLPDAADNQMGSLVDMTLGAQLPYLGVPILLSAADIDGEGAAYASVPAPSSVDTWGNFDWGIGHWSGMGSPYHQWAVDWDQPVVCKQALFTATGQSGQNTRIGNINAKRQTLGYMLQRDTA